MHARQRVLADGQVYRTADSQLVEGRRIRVQEEVARALARHLAVAVGMRSHLTQHVRRGRVQHVVELAAQHVLRRTRRSHDLHGDPVHLGRGNARELEVLHALENEPAASGGPGDAERPDARRRLLREVAEGRVSRHYAGVERGQHVRERAIRRRELDRYRPVGVVGLDAGDVPVRLWLLRVLGGAPHAGEEAGGRGPECQEALDGVLEVGGLHRLAVRVGEPLSEAEAVGHSVGRDLRELLGQPRDQLRAPLPLGVPVGEQRGVDEPHRLPPVDRVAQGGVERVRLGRLRDGDGAARVGIVTARGQHRRERQGHRAGQCGHSSSTTWRVQAAPLLRVAQARVKVQRS